MKSIGLMLLIVGMLLIGYGGLSLANLLFDAGPPQSVAPAETTPPPPGSPNPDGSAGPTPDSTPTAESTDSPPSSTTPGTPAAAAEDPSTPPTSAAELAEGSSRVIAIGGVGAALAFVGAVLIVIGLSADRRDPNEQGAS